jgi:hypothetical protein
VPAVAPGTAEIRLGHLSNRKAVEKVLCNRVSDLVPKFYTGSRRDLGLGHPSYLTAIKYGSPSSNSIGCNWRQYL